MLEDGPGLLHQRIAPVSDRGRVEHLIVNISQQRAVFFRQQPEAGGCGAMRINTGLEIERNVARRTDERGGCGYRRGNLKRMLA